MAEKVIATSDTIENQKVKTIKPSRREACPCGEQPNKKACPCGEHSNKKQPSESETRKADES